MRVQTDDGGEYGVVRCFRSKNVKNTKKIPPFHCPLGVRGHVKGSGWFTAPTPASHFRTRVMLFDSGFDWEEDAPAPEGTEQHPDSQVKPGKGGKGLVCSTGRPPKYHLKPTTALKLVPSRLISRVTGTMYSIPLPKRVRGSVFRTYSWAFGVNLDEVR